MTEPWGQVINEAMHFGLAIAISKSCGSAEDLCNTDNSRKFNPYKQQELTNIFRDLLDDDTLLSKMGKASLNIIKANSPDILIKRQVEFLNRIIKTHSYIV